MFIIIRNNIIIIMNIIIVIDEGHLAAIIIIVIAMISSSSTTTTTTTIIIIIIIIIIVTIVNISAMYKYYDWSRRRGAPSARRARCTRSPFIGWSNNHFDNLHFRSSLETEETTTCAAEN